MFYGNNIYCQEVEELMVIVQKLGGINFILSARYDILWEATVSAE